MKSFRHQGMVACMIYTKHHPIDPTVIHGSDRHMSREIMPEAKDIDYDPQTPSIYWIYRI